MMQANQTQRKTDKAALKAYLQQYSTALQQRDALRRRRAAFAAKNSPAATAMAIRLEKQQAHLTHALEAITDTIELLPPTSTERAVIEMRHIDNFSWTKIAARLYISRSTAFNYYNRALDQLFRDKNVRAKVKRFAHRNNA